jgi:hypothetical protein
MVGGPEDGAATVTETGQVGSVSPAQTRATFAYARTLLEPDVAEPAAEDALAAFGQAVAARTAAGTEPDPDGAGETLLALTRLMTAVSVPDRSSPADRRQALWASIGHSSHCTCRESAALLATRANGNISARESTALDEHLATCADCRDLSARAVAAEAAFRRELTPPAGPGGFTIPSVPRSAYGVLGVVIAVIVAGILLLSGGSKSNTSRAAIAPIPHPAAAALNSPATEAKATKRAVKPHHVTVKPRKRVVRQHVAATATTTQTATTTAPTQPAATLASNTGAASSAAGTGSASAAAGTTGAGATHAAAATTPSSSAAVVSGSSSLPADSAPQQGIGSLTSTTP